VTVSSGGETGVALVRKENPRMHDEGSAVAVGIDAAVVANHHIVVRRAVAGGAGTVIEEFTAAPSLSGLALLTKRLGGYPGVMAVAELCWDWTGFGSWRSMRCRTS
jgi:hypothetical protein